MLKISYYKYIMTYFSNLSELKYGLILNTQFNINTILFPRYYSYFLPQSTEFYRCLRIEELHDGYFGTRFGAKYRPIGSIDLSIDPTNKITEINWWMVNDDFHHKFCPDLYAPILSYSDADIMRQNLLLYAEYNAKKYGCNKIQRDVNNKLTEYNHSLKNNGFILTKERAKDNPYWLKTYKYL